MKKRLDVLLTEKGLFSSREKAKAYIMSGEIFVNGEREDKPGSTFDEDCIIEHRGKSQKYVSRGGQKLEKAMQSFSIELEDKVCMDVGASTGGFTDCMLQNGEILFYLLILQSLFHDIQFYFLISKLHYLVLSNSLYIK